MLALPSLEGTAMQVCSEEEEGDELVDQEAEFSQLSLLQLSWTLEREAARDRQPHTETPWSQPEALHRKHMNFLARQCIRALPRTMPKRSLAVAFIEAMDDPRVGMGGNGLLLVGIIAGSAVLIFFIAMVFYMRHRRTALKQKYTKKEQLEEKRIFEAAALDSADAQTDADSEESTLGLDIEEEGTDADGDGIPDHIARISTAVYIFAGAVIVVGLYMFVVPVDTSEMIVRVLLVCSGVYLILNIDIVVNVVRLYSEVLALKANTEHLKRRVKSLGAKVEGLKKLEKGFEEIDKKFSGSIDKAMQETEKIKRATKQNIAISMTKLSRLYIDKDHNRIVDVGDELEHALKVMASLISGFSHGVTGKMPKLQRALEAHPKAQQDGGVGVSVLSEVLTVTVLDAPGDLEAIVDAAFSKRMAFT